MSTAVIRELEEVSIKRERGGGGKIKPEDKPGPGYHAVGIVYAKQDGADSVEIKISYVPQLSNAVKDEIASRFGVGAREWQVTEKESV